MLPSLHEQPPTVGPVLNAVQATHSSSSLTVSAAHRWRRTSHLDPGVVRAESTRCSDLPMTVRRVHYRCGEEHSRTPSQLPTRTQEKLCGFQSFRSYTMGNSLTLTLEDRLIQAFKQSQLSLTLKIRLQRTKTQEASPAVAFHSLLADRWSPKRRKPVPANQNKCTISMQIYPNLSPAKGLAPV